MRIDRSNEIQPAATCESIPTCCNDDANVRTLTAFPRLVGQRRVGKLRMVFGENCRKKRWFCGAESEAWASDQSGAITTCARTRSHLADCSVHTCAAQLHDSRAGARARLQARCSGGGLARLLPLFHPITRGESPLAQSQSACMRISGRPCTSCSMRVYVSYSTRMYARAACVISPGANATFLQIRRAKTAVRGEPRCNAPAFALRRSSCVFPRGGIQFPWCGIYEKFRGIVHRNRRDRNYKESRIVKILII